MTAARTFFASMILLGVAGIFLAAGCVGSRRERRLKERNDQLVVLDYPIILAKKVRAGEMTADEMVWLLESRRDRIEASLTRPQ